MWCFKSKVPNKNGNGLPVCGDSVMTYPTKQLKIFSFSWVPNISNGGIPYLEDQVHGTPMTC